MVILHCVNTEARVSVKFNICFEQKSAERNGTKISIMKVFLLT